MKEAMILILFLLGYIVFVALVILLGCWIVNKVHLPDSEV